MSIRWGVIGCGTVATNRTVPEGIINARNAQLVAVADIKPERAEAISVRYGGRVYPSAEDLLRDPEVDAVYAAVPPFAHAELAILTAQHKKALLLEKPMAMNTAQAGEILAAHRSAGTLLGIGFMMRYHACHSRMKAMIDAGEIGRIVAVRARYSVWYRPDPEHLQENWIFDPQRAGGGPLMDVGVHALDLMTWMVGRVERLACFADTLAQGCAVEDACSILLRFAGGAHGVLQAYNCTPNFVGRNVLEVHGTRGTLVAQNSLSQLPTGILTHYPVGADAGRIEAPGQGVDVQPVNMYQTEIERFSDCLERADAYPISGEVGLAIQRLTDAAYQSAREGQFISIGPSG